MSEKNNRRKKILAVLAAGLVLGVGGAVTLAAWSDSEFAGSTFTAGTFNLEGATDGPSGTYAQHADAGTAADLTFTVPLATSLSPDDVVYAPFWVRLDSTTAGSGTLAAAGITATAGGNSAHLAHTVYAIAPDATCDATAAVTGTLVTEGADLTSFSETATPVPLAPGADGSAGAPVQLCFIVTAGDELEQGGVTEATWSFSATSA